MSNHSCPFHVIGVDGLFLLCLWNQLVIRLLWNGINFGIGDSCLYKGWNTLHDFCTDFCPGLQYGRVYLSWWKWEQVCRFWTVRVDRFHRKPCSVWWAQTRFHLVREYQNVWYFRTSCISHASTSNKTHVSAWVDALYFSVTIYKFGKLMMSKSVQILKVV